MRRVLTLAAAAIAVLAFAAPAGAARWPTRRVTYRDLSHAHAAVRYAVRLWNRATTAVHLAPARGRRAQIRIYSRDCPSPAERGVTTLCAFYPRDGRVFLGGAPGDARGPYDPLTTLTAHEIGHALGLTHGAAHGNTCNLMYPYNPLTGGAFVPPCRRRLAPGWFACGPQLADVRALIALYGGRVRRGRHFGQCPDPSYIPPRGTLVEPHGPVLVQPPGPAPVRVRVRNDSGRTWPASTMVLRVLSPQGGGCPGASTRGSALTAGRTPRGATATYTFAACRIASERSGTMRLRLELGLTGYTGPTFTVAYRWATQPPAADFTYGPDSSGDDTSGQTVDFAADVSDPDGGTVTHERWDFGDGTSESGDYDAGPAHTYASAGTYHVELTATDDEGESTTVAHDVTVPVDSGFGSGGA